MANLYSPEIERDLQLKLARDTIKHQMQSIVEQAIIDVIMPSIKTYAKSAVASYNDIRVDIQKLPDPLEPSRVLVTFVEEAIHKHYNSPTVVEER